MLPDWFGQLGLMAWPLAFCSVAATAVCIERSVFVLRCLSRRNRTFLEMADKLNAYKRYPKHLRDEIASAMLSELQGSHMNGIRLLRVIGTISPMLGLVGTILGVINAFKMIAANMGPVTPHIIAEGLWEAMLTTAVGLSIALPSVFMAYLFQAFSMHRLNRLAARLNRLSMAIEIDAVGPQTDPPHERTAA